MQERLEGYIDNGGSIVNPWIKHPDIHYEPECIEPGDVCKDETEAVVHCGEQSKDNPIGQPNLFLLIFIAFDCLNEELCTL